MGLTDGLTFIVISPYQNLLIFSILSTPCDTAARQIIHRQFYSYLVTGKDANVIHSQFSRDRCEDLVIIRQFDFEHSVRISFGNYAFDFDNILFGHL